MQESDTTSEWTKKEISQFLVWLSPSPSLSLFSRGAILSPEILTEEGSTANSFNLAHAQCVVNDLMNEFTGSDLENIRSFSEAKNGIPREFDGRLIARCRSKIGRDLTTEEKKRVRQMLLELVLNASEQVI